MAPPPSSRLPRLLLAVGVRRLGGAVGRASAVIRLPIVPVAAAPPSSRRLLPLPLIRCRRLRQSGCARRAAMCRLAASRLPVVSVTTATSTSQTAGRPGDDRHVDIPDCRSFRWRRRRHPGCRGCCWRSASAASAAPLAAPAPSSGCPSYRWRQHRRHPGGSFNAVVQIAKFDTPKPSYSECSRTARTAGWARTAPQRLDLWVLPATNRPREDEAPAGRFRKDLLCRLNVFGRDAPPLRDTCSSAVTVTVPDETGAERAAGCVGYELAADLDFGHQRGWTQRPAGAGTAHAGCPPRAGMIRRYDRGPRPTPTLHPHGRG